MKRSLSMMMLAALAVGSHAQSLTTLTAGDGSIYRIQANSFTANPASTSSTGVHTVDFIPLGGLENAFRNLFAFRQTGDTREWWVTSASASFTSTADSFTASVNRAVNNTGPNTLNFTINHRITDILGPSTPMVITTVTVTNLSAVDRGVTLFNYLDFDINGSGGNDTIRFNQPDAFGIRASMGDTADTTKYVDMWAEGASRWRQGTLVTTNFTNTVIDDLPNTVTAGNGDFGLTFQWGERTIAAGQSTTYSIYQSLNTPVPEPASMTALGLGVAAMLRRRKAKKS